MLGPFLIFLFIAFLVFITSVYNSTYSIKDVFSPARWRAVFVWLLKKTLHKMGETNKYLTTSELIQYTNRVSKCGRCLQEGKCIHCGCNAEGKINGTTDSCEHGTFPAFMSEKEMTEFLKTHYIELTDPIIKEKIVNGRDTV